MNRVFFWFLGLCLLSGCTNDHQTPSNMRPEAPQQRVLDNSESLQYVISQSQLAPKDYLNSLKPFSTGPGVIVLEPISSSDKLQNFGAGCSRWINLELGRQPQLEKTPLWNGVAGGRDQYKLANLRLSPQDCLPIAKYTGATHIVTGSISGTNSQCQLTYKVSIVHGDRVTPLQPYIKIQGSTTDILKRLPFIAHQIAKTLGVTSPKVADSTNLSTQEMSGVGSINWGGENTSQEKKILRPLLKKSPLATFLYITAGSGLSELPELAQYLIKQEPDNIHFISGLTRSDPVLLSNIHPTWEQIYQRHPHNYLLTYTQIYQARYFDDDDTTLQASERVVRIAPKNANSWSELASSWGTASQTIRQGRVASEIPPAEWQKLHKIYAIWQAVAQRATQVNPVSSRTWYEFSTAAMFNTDLKTADKALWKSIQLEPSHARAYKLGLQLYQPKWMNDKKKLLKIARMAAQNAHSHDQKEVDELKEHITYALTAANLKSQLPALLKPIKIQSTH